MQYFYDGQIRRYLLQIVRLLSNFVVRAGDGSLTRIPVMYGDADRQAASIINQNSENTLQAAPKMAVYISGLELDRNRLSDATFVGKVNIRERGLEEDGQHYNSLPGQNYTVERLMPTPFKLTVKVDIWSSSTEQKLQILEQLLVLFNPSLEIQTTDNYIDWTSLSVVDLNDVVFSSRSVPVGTNVAIDIATLTLETPIWITPPAKVKKLGVVTNIITSIFGAIGDPDSGYIDGLAVDPNTGDRYPGDFIFSQKTTIGNFDIIVFENKVKMISNTDPGKYLHWTMIIDQHPGLYHAGLSKIFLRQPDNSEVVGYFSINALDDSEIIVNWDEDTFPTNTSIPGPARPAEQSTTFDAIIDPTKTGPRGSGLNPVPGSRYLVIDNVGGGVRDELVTTSKTQRIVTTAKFDRVNSCQVFVNDVEITPNSPENRNDYYVIVLPTLVPAGTNISYIVNLNEDGPDAWKNNDGSDFIAEVNDIIEWDGDKWWIVFSARENTDQLIYITNIFTLVQYKWDGLNWTKSFDGEYRRGEWRLEL